MENYEIALNENTAQFTLRVLEFHWLAAAAEMIGQPHCIMSDPAIRSLFDAALAARAQPSFQPATRANIFSEVPKSTEPFLLRLQRRSYPMERACFPVRARAPHMVMAEYMDIPDDQLVMHSAIQPFSPCTAQFDTHMAVVAGAQCPVACSPVGWLCLSR